MVGPAAGSEDDFVEVQVAEWRDGAPVTPAQKTRPVSLGFETTRPTAIQLDIRPIVAEWNGGGAMVLTLGKLSADCWGEPQVVALDTGGQIYCTLHLVTE
jgi:hypothetical protein